MRHVEVRAGLYRDSVRLMEISRALADLPGVDAALVAMATGLNLDLLSGMGFAAPDKARANDMLVALVAQDDTTLSVALDRLSAELAGARKGTLQSPLVPEGAPAYSVPPRTVGSAVRAFGASLALVSTPGRYAFLDAMDALDAGVSVLVFSDNVPVEQEVALKRTAAARGLLVMGPDCGTAVVGGVGLGFANVVRPGPVGLVAASGTGAQQVMSLLGWAGVGISHCLGVGGRDHSAAVGGRSTHAALDVLDADPATELIVVLGKPPAAQVAEAVRSHADRLGTPVVFAPLGLGQPDLTAAAEAVLRHLGHAVPDPWPCWLPEKAGSSDGAGGRAGPAGAGGRGGASGALRGLFSGGTLCLEAMVIAAEALGPVYSNIPLRPEWAAPPQLAPPQLTSPRDLGVVPVLRDQTTGRSPRSTQLGGESAAHVMIDLGDDEYTVGRPHPMIDAGPRLECIAAEAADPGCRVMLLDVVLGHGAHPDPAAEFAPAIRAALAGRPEGDLAVVASLIGTAEDPQDVRRQADLLCEAGARVFSSNAAAARHAVSLLGSGGTR